MGDENKSSDKEGGYVEKNEKMTTENVQNMRYERELELLICFHFYCHLLIYLYCVHYTYCVNKCKRREGEIRTDDTSGCIERTRKMNK